MNFVTKLKFMVSKKATEFDKIFAVDVTLCIKCQIDSEDFVNFCGLLGIYELYQSKLECQTILQQNFEIWIDFFFIIEITPE